jgi:hypothetical protein
MDEKKGANAHTPEQGDGLNELITAELYSNDPELKSNQFSKKQTQDENLSPIDITLKSIIKKIEDSKDDNVESYKDIKQKCVEELLNVMRNSDDFVLHEAKGRRFASQVVNYITKKVGKDTFKQNWWNEFVSKIKDLLVGYNKERFLKPRELFNPNDTSFMDKVDIIINNAQNKMASDAHITWGGSNAQVTKNNQRS